MLIQVCQRDNSRNDDLFSEVIRFDLSSKLLSTLDLLLARNRDFFDGGSVWAAVPDDDGVGLLTARPFIALSKSRNVPGSLVPDNFTRGAVFTFVVPAR